MVLMLKEAAHALWVCFLGLFSSNFRAERASLPKLPHIRPDTREHQGHWLGPPQVSFHLALLLAQTQPAGGGQARTWRCLSPEEPTLATPAWPKRPSLCPYSPCFSLHWFSKKPDTVTGTMSSEDFENGKAFMQIQGIRGDLL